MPNELGLFKASVEPASGEPRDVTLVTVAVNDPDNKVDTVAARFRDLPDSTLDLFDNGTQGDQTAGDGIWSRRVPVFPALQPGPQVLEIMAYNVNGQPVKGEDGTPIKAEVQLTVIAPE
jgi:hypothetical protein